MPGMRDSILETIADNPVVRVNTLAPEGVKLEAFNPLGSIKDRLALGVIEAAERAGAPETGQTVVEARAAIPASASPWSARRTAIRCRCDGRGFLGRT